jgi:hypothetical protein
LLRGWKQAREEAANRERTGSSSPGAGWIDQVQILEGPRFAPGFIIKFDKVTIVDSDRSVGKTTLFEWIASSAGHASFNRWQGAKVRLQIRYSSPSLHRLEFTSEKERREWIQSR